MDPIENQIEKEARLFVQQSEEKEQPIIIGKSQKYQDELLAIEHPVAMDIGWKNVPINELPSSINEKGIQFYPEGTQIAIRSASVAEIRHFSGIDENDGLNVLDMLIYIIDKCCRIKIPGKQSTYKDIKELDKFYLIFAVRDYTFINGENHIYVTVEDSEAKAHKIKLTKDLLDYFNPDELLVRNYNLDTQSFQFTIKDTGEKFNLYMPSLGVIQWITKYAKDKREKGQNFDKSFIKYAPFIFPEWRLLNDKSYEKLSSDSSLWSFKKISIIERLIELLTSSINTNIKYTLNNGEEGTTPINFPGGLKSLFIISDIASELL